MPTANASYPASVRTTVASASGVTQIEPHASLAYEHEPPSTTVRGSASLAHLILHVESPAQDSEQFAVHRSVHVEPPSQLMLPLGPTVTSHSEPALQLTLHDAPQVPSQLL